MLLQHVFWETAARYEFRGVWMTAPEIAAITGIGLRTTYRRIRLGLPIEDAPRRGPIPKLLEFRGRQCTIAEIAAETGYTRSTVSKRHDGKRFFERGETLDENAGLRTSSTPIFYNGITDSIAGWSRRTGLSRTTISDRLRLGFSVKETLTAPARRGRILTLMGVSDTAAGWAERLGIARSTLACRLAQDGWTMGRALTEAPLSRGDRAARAKALHRMGESFAASAATPPAIQPERDTGGDVQTSLASLPTGAPSTKHDLHGELP